MIRKTNTDRQTDRKADIWIHINGEVKVAVIWSKIFFSCSKPLHERVQYVLHESAKYQNFSQALRDNPASILRKSTSGRHRPVSYPDGPMTARYRFT